MFKSIVVMLKSTTSIIRRVYIDAFYFSCKILFKCFERKEVVGMNQHIPGVAFTVRFFGIFNQYARFRFYLKVFSRPAKFQLIVITLHSNISNVSPKIVYLIYMFTFLRMDLNV